MPRSSSQETITRQWTLLRCLPTRRPGNTAGGLRAELEKRGFSVSKRTVERDLTDLSTLFPIRSNEVSKPYGWYWADGGESLLPEMDATAALSLCLAESTLRSVLPPAFLAELDERFKRARKNLKGASKSPQGKWRGKVRVVPGGVEFKPPVITPAVFDTIHQALLAEKKLELLYQGPYDSGPKELGLCPLGLVLRGSTAYLVATAIPYEDIRIYALHRMHSVVVTTDRCMRPKGFSLDDYIASGAFGFGNPEPVELRAEVSEDLARYLAETPFKGGQVLAELEKNRVLLTATVKDTWELRWWILGQGRKIRVLEPKVLRDAIREELSKAIAGYESEHPE